MSTSHRGPENKARIGAVAIGRNEGERLERCLASLQGRVDQLVYVDSGSTDGSVALAKSLGAEVVSLDMKLPFTAARARNEGFAKLDKNALDYVQFVDGDCEVSEGWLEHAQERLAAAPRVAVVCGRRRERFPEASIYNRVIDVEWNTPVGETKACGGDALMRIDAFAEVNGFDASLIAGEEPDLCLRMRARGWTIERLDHEMTLHDAAITRFGQFWKRAVRSGHAFAEGADRHGQTPERHWVKETQRIVLWGAVIPGVAVSAALPTAGLSLGLLLGYPVSAYRAYKAVHARGIPDESAIPYAAFMTVAKFAEMQGVGQYWTNKTKGRRSGLIEYK